MAFIYPGLKRLFEPTCIVYTLEKIKLENLKSSFPKKRNWSESLCLKIIKVVQTTTWTKSDINPSDYLDLVGYNRQG